MSGEQMLLELAAQLERIAERERAHGGIFALPKSDCKYIERAADTIRAIAHQMRIKGND